MKKFIKENWFNLVVVILLLMVYSRLGQIKENTFYTADMVDASASRVINSMEDSNSDLTDSVNNLEGYLDEINNNTNRIKY